MTKHSATVYTCDTCGLSEQVELGRPPDFRTLILQVVGINDSVLVSEECHFCSATCAASYYDELFVEFRKPALERKLKPVWEKHL
jgi:hypothetical protein